MNTAIAVVGLACRYPDANSPQELWENALAQRRAFRRMPDVRMRLADYYAADTSVPDRTYGTEAAVINGFEFDRVQFRVVGSTFRSADLAHWLALEVAANALAEAGFPDADGLPRLSTGVLVGNSLTGEFSRANIMRLRWPYVQRVVEQALVGEGWDQQARARFLQQLEADYKAPFPPIGEETLAGGLSNTIAGRICNYFDLQGGGYTVDGACSSSLLAVANACSALAVGDLDVALAGGVDLSLDPFELIGFAKTGALAADQMRVYDTRGAGFWPGEGCGFAVLMRLEDAIAQRRRVRAVVRGWGVSSDGRGGMTRPEVEGQLLAVQRAYHRAGYGPDSVGYFEGHGTGTTVGDTTELRMLTRARHERNPAVRPAVISSIKAQIGHTKAASGIAGFIKTVMALEDQILPPAIACEQPHAELSGPQPALRVLRSAELWPADVPLRAGVSAMGFGGINTHVTLESLTSERQHTLYPSQQMLVSSAQDSEIFFLSAPTPHSLMTQVAQVRSYAAQLAYAELSDLAAELSRTLRPHRVRAALVASSPSELAQGLELLASWLSARVTQQFDQRAGVFLGTGTEPPRIGFLFPGQGAPAHVDGGAWRRRFGAAQAIYDWARLPATTNTVATNVAQPAIVAASLAGLAVLDQLKLQAQVAAGHSLGELSALHWGGALNGAEVFKLATARGAVMAALGASDGSMASLGASAEAVKELLAGTKVVIAGLNTPEQTVIAGPSATIKQLVGQAQERGWLATQLAVSHAFHSPLVAEVSKGLAPHLAEATFQPLQRRVASTVTGAILVPDAPLPHLLAEQITSPVRFTEALAAVAAEADLLIEVGPGRALSGMAAHSTDLPVFALDAGGPSLRGLFNAVAAAWSLGAAVDHATLFAGRFARRFDLNWQGQFFVNPCELAPVVDDAAVVEPLRMTATPPPRLAPAVLDSVPLAADEPLASAGQSSILELVRQLLAERTELPVAAVGDQHHLLNDLHLNSISVSQVVIEAARRLGLQPPVAPTEYANATVADMAHGLEQLQALGVPTPTSTPDYLVPGVDSWVRAFSTRRVARPMSAPAPTSAPGRWQVFTPEAYPLRASLEQAFAHLPHTGIVACVAPQPSNADLAVLLNVIKAAQAEAITHVVLVQHGGGVAAMARSLHLEVPRLRVCVVDVPIDHPAAATWIAAEALVVESYTEAVYDAAGQRWEEVIEVVPLDPAQTNVPLGPQDVLLVTGGGKGITAECAFELAKASGARLALWGRTLPADNQELDNNLARMSAAGLTVRYDAVDVTDPAAVAATVALVEQALGPITAIMHGAARNEPQLLQAVSETSLRRTLAPKVDGLQALLGAIKPEQLRLLIAFGSVIARTGLRGEAEYALANDWLALTVDRFQAAHPTCRCLTLEWSVWAGLGMGERLGSIDHLIQQGILPIPPDAGIAMLQQVLAQPVSGTRLIVTSRFANTPTLKLAKPELPFLRFLERPRVFYPGIELIVEADLSLDTDPYLNDHVFRGERLVPAVIGLEAMAQAAQAVTGTTQLPTFEQASFPRPIVVAAQAGVTVRIVALVRAPGVVDVAIRSAETGFQVDHFLATCRFDSNAPQLPAVGTAPAEQPILAIDPAHQLYGGLFFHTGRFQRVQNYRQLRARACLAEVATDQTAAWFGRYLPPTLLLGDAAARDAVIHAIQVCVPNAQLLPIGIERLTFAAPLLPGPRFVHAQERAQIGELFIYDVRVTTADGTLTEEWFGLRLQQIVGATLHDAWVAPLLGPYVERYLDHVSPTLDLAVVVDQDAANERQTRSDRAIRRVLDQAVQIVRRTDGKPETDADRAVSVAHATDLTLVIAGPGPLGCDLEPVTARSVALWRDLVGAERWLLAEHLATEANEVLDQAATRVWAASEALTKAEAIFATPLVLHSVQPDGWVVLQAGRSRIATYVASLRDRAEPLVVAVLLPDLTASLRPSEHLLAPVLALVETA